MTTDRGGLPQRVVAGGFDRLPIDPDIEPEELPRRRKSRWPRLQAGVVLAVFVGGFFGGLARYGIGDAAPTPNSGFPYSTFAINLSGAFLLALLLVLLLEVLPPTRFLRPALGTGFLGAYTTFSSLATSTDQLAAHGHAGLAVAYAGSSLFGGLACASFGLVAGRAVNANGVAAVGKETTNERRGDLQLSVLVSEHAHYRHHPLYSEIVHRAHKQGLAGASAFRGIEGFGHSHHLHEERLLDFSGHLPVLVVVIDTESRVRQFLTQLADITPLAMLVTLSRSRCSHPSRSRRHDARVGRRRARRSRRGLPLRRRPIHPAPARQRVPVGHVRDQHRRLVRVGFGHRLGGSSRVVDDHRDDRRRRICAGFTTFSTWMWETLALSETGALLEAMLNIFGSLAIGLAAAAAGFALALT